MTKTHELTARLLNSFNIENFNLPVTFVKLYKQGEVIPEKVKAHHIDEETVMSCQAVRHASQGNPVLLTIKNIGCVAAAISFGLVDKEESKALAGNRTYTDLMQFNTEKDSNYAPSPAQFTSGDVYACGADGDSKFCMFGSEDSGRYKDKKTAQRATAGMMVIQPPTTQGVFFFDNNFTEIDLEPDVVLLSVEPRELTRLIQGYMFETGERIDASMGGLRAVDSDLIVRPILTGRINISSYCLGARLLARFEGDRMGMGIPWNCFETLVTGMESSITGFPFEKYPEASHD